MVTHYCPKCDATVPADEVSERGRHEVCGGDTRLVVEPEGETWWQRHGLAVMGAWIGVMLGVVIIWNAWGGK